MAFLDPKKYKAIFPKYMSELYGRLGTHEKDLTSLLPPPSLLVAVSTLLTSPFSLSL